MKKLNIVIFGATGSIGNSTLSIIKKNRNSLNIEGITCNSNLLQLQKIAKNYNVKKIGYNKKAIKFDSKLKFNGYEVFEDVANFHNMISINTDIIIFAIGGLSPLKLLIEILKSGKTVGMANKECIITLGNKFNKLAKKHSTDIIPLDSEQLYLSFVKTKFRKIQINNNYSHRWHF